MNRAGGRWKSWPKNSGSVWGMRRKSRRRCGERGRMERTEQRHGRINQVTPWVQERLREWLRQQPDRTLAEWQRQLREQI